MAGEGGESLFLRVEDSHSIVKSAIYNFRKAFGTTIAIDLDRAAEILT